jgi:hypothetical protein
VSLCLPRLSERAASNFVTGIEFSCRHEIGAVLRIDNGVQCRLAFGADRLPLRRPTKCCPPPAAATDVGFSIARECGRGVPTNGTSRILSRLGRVVVTGRSAHRAIAG